ncbi:MAG: diacylglycerol/lipid kinase family protein, partial [Thermoguttaceae bacterium]
GLDAEVVRQVHCRRRGHVRLYNYIKALYKTLFTYEHPEMRVYCTEDSRDGSKLPCFAARWFAVFNIPCYGGGLRIAPFAVGNDSELDLCGFRRGNIWRFLEYIAAIYLRRHQRMNDWFTRRSRRLRIESDVPVPYQLDGDPGGWLPLEIEVLPKRLTMLVPQKTLRMYREESSESGF